MEAEPEDLASLLRETAEHYMLNRDPQNIHRIAAFQKAADIISEQPGPITLDTRLKLPGIGSSTQTFIREYLSTGKVERLEQLRRDYPLPPEIELFRTIYSVGYATAKHWYDLGYRTLSDLYNGNSELHLLPVLSEAMRISVKWRLHLELKIERQEIDLLGEVLKAILPPAAVFEIAGSYRRQEASSNDVDVIVMEDEDNGINIASVMEALDPLIVATLIRGGEFQGIYRLKPYREFNAHRLDVWMVQPDSWAAALVAYTGSGPFNRMLRHHARKTGYLLNEKGLFRLSDGAKTDTPTEESVFLKLGLKYLEPRERKKSLSVLR